MIFPLLRDLLPSPVWEIIQYLKHSSGLTIQELSELMDMSYMGVKKHCDAMVSKGYLDTWRRSQSHGRPEKVYRLTDKLVPLFPGGDNGLLREMLGHAERVFGPSAAEKLIYAFFQNRFERYAERLAGETELENRALELARLRTADGCMSVVEVTPDRTAIRLIDHHQPWQFLLKKYPCIEAIEGDMIERLLGCPIERSIEQHSGLRRTIYQLVSRSR